MKIVSTQGFTFATTLTCVLTCLSIGLSASADTSAADVAPTAAPTCPSESTLSQQDLGSGTFGLTGGPKLFAQLRDKFEAANHDELPKVTSEDATQLNYEAPVFHLEIRPTAYKAMGSCAAYNKTYPIKKTFEVKSANAQDCKKQTEDQVSDWTQGTLVGSTSIWVSGDTPEGDILYKACPDPCSYSSVQENIFSYDGSTCQIRTVLTVTCGAPKAQSEFIATGTLMKKQICALKPVP